MTLANINWSFDSYADNAGVYATAFNDVGQVVCQADGANEIECGKELYRQLAAQFGANGKTLVSKNGNKLTADGPA